jgi:hypothetical protein
MVIDSHCLVYLSALTLRTLVMVYRVNLKKYSLHILPEKVFILHRRAVMTLMN